MTRTQRVLWAIEGAFAIVVVAYLVRPLFA